MFHYRTSSDDTTKKYYFEVTTKTLDSGFWDVSFEFEYLDQEYNIESGICLVDSYSANFFVENSEFNFNALFAISSVFSLLGTAPLTMFAAIGTLAMAKKVSAINLLGVGVLAYTGIIISTSMVGLLENDDIGGLLGFSIGCIFLWVIISTMLVFDDDEASFNPLATSILNGVLGPIKYTRAMQLIIQVLIPYLSLLFGNDTPTETVLAFANNILSYVPVIIGVYIATYAFLFAAAANWVQFKGDKFAKALMWCFRIYKMMLIFAAISGFMLTHLETYSEGSLPL